MRKIRFEDKFIKLLSCEFGDNQSIFDVGLLIKIPRFEQLLNERASLNPNVTMDHRALRT